MNKIRIGIVEDDPDWLRGLIDYLNRQPDIAVVWSARDGDTLATALDQSFAAGASAQVVLMDIMLDGKPAGISLAETTALSTGAPVIMLTSMEEKELILQSFQAGAIDYQLKSSFEQLPAAIRSAFEKRAPISAAAAAQLREEFRRLKAIEKQFEAKKMGDLITPSELQLLDLIEQGYSQPQIAGKLFITLRTVKNHVNRILKKLGMERSSEAAGKAREMGLLDQLRSNKNDSDN